MALFDPYRQWLGIPPKEQPPNHYRLLGIGPFESDPDVISNAADRQMTHVRTYQSGKRSELSQQILNELAAARVCLLDPSNKAKYDSQLRAKGGAEQTVVPPPSAPQSTTGPPPPRENTAAPPQAGVSPVPQVASTGSTFSPATRSAGYSTRRKKKSNPAGVLITVSLILISGVLLIWALNRPSKEATPKPSASKRNGNGSSGRTTHLKTPRTPTRSPGGNRPRPPIGPFPAIPVAETVGEIRSLSGHSGPVTGAAFSPVGIFAVSGSEDKSVCKWDLQSGGNVMQYKGSADPVLSVAVSADGRHVLAVTGQPEPRRGTSVHVWEAASGEGTLRLEVPTGESVEHALFDPGDGTRVLLAYADGTISLFDTVGKSEVRQFIGHQGAVHCLAFSRDGSQVLSAGADGTVRLWDRNADKELLVLQGHQGPVTCVAFSPDQAQAVSGGADRTLRFWDLKTGTPASFSDKHRDAVASVDYSSDGRFVVSGSLDGTVRVFRATDAVEVHFVGEHPGGVRSAAFGPDDRRVLSAGNDKLARLWRLPDLSPLPDLPPTGPGIQPVDPPTEPNRLAVPDAKARQEAEELVRNVVFKQEFEAADRPSLKAALAQKLFDEGNKPQQNVALPFVLLTLARDLAVELGDADTALRAVDRLAETYQLDGPSEKTDAFEALARATLPAAGKRTLVERMLLVVDEAQAADDFDSAGRLVALAQATTLGPRDGPLKHRITATAQRVEQLNQVYQKVAAAHDVLKQQPDDPAANEIVGRYHCFVKGEWPRGLPRLAAGADETLKTLAQTDLADPTVAAEQLALADQWWNVAANYDGAVQEQIRWHAASWYRLVEPDLVGVQQSKARQRLAEAGDPAAPAAAATLPSVKGLECRNDAHRPAMLAYFGGNDASEAAVARALDWLSRHQRADDGSWNFDHTGPHCQDRCADPGTFDVANNAATALALLPFLGAGHGPRDGKYQKNVSLGLIYLKDRMAWQGSLYERGVNPMPSHALGTIALCEACAVTRDAQTRGIAQAAVSFIVETQNAGGGWGPKPPLPPDGEGDPSDVLTTGWNLAALRTAEWAGLNVPQKAFTRADEYLDSMRTESGTGFRRNENQAADRSDPTATAVAALALMYAGRPRDDEAIADAVASLSKSGPSTSGDFHTGYFQSHLMRQFGGTDWQTWGPKARDHLVFTQADEGHEAGSWHAAQKGWCNESGGRLLSTVLAALSLEVYYRHPPLYPPGR